MLIKNSKRWAGATLKCYLMAILGVAIAFFIRLQLHPILESAFPVLFFVINTTFVAYKFGLGPSILTILLSIPLGYFYFIPPYNSFELEGPIDIITISIYLIFFVMDVYIIEKLQRERYRAILIARVCESRMNIMAKLSSTANRRAVKDVSI